MKIARCLMLLVASFLLASCDASTQSVEVFITADGYKVGDVKSALATPAVDEVVRINPKKVLLIMCRETPPTKTLQFQVELTARSKALQQGSISSQGCPA